MFGTILAVAVFAQPTALVGFSQWIIQPVQKVAAALAQIQNTLDADRGVVTVWAAIGKLAQAALVAQKVTHPTVFH